MRGKKSSAIPGIHCLSYCLVHTFYALGLQYTKARPLSTDKWGDEAGILSESNDKLPPLRGVEVRSRVSLCCLSIRNNVKMSWFSSWVADRKMGRTCSRGGVSTTQRRTLHHPYQSAILTIMLKNKSAQRPVSCHIWIKACALICSFSPVHLI